MERALQGHYLTISTTGETARAFVPFDLPPQPDIDWSTSLRNKFDQALLALGRLDSVSLLLPETSLFLYMYIRKEAILSSQIEGTQSSLSDLLLFEAHQQTGVSLDDVEEVSNYVAALNHGLKRLASGFPLSLRLINEMHSILLAKGRGSDKTPGEFRRTQNWIGGSRPGNAVFVPPPPDKVSECMGKLELFLHNKPVTTPTLLKAALMHVQFETIHPFLDGNGRLGRLLITLLFCEEHVLKEPMLYLSLYFKAHRSHYYALLDKVRNTGDWEAWLDFFADAVIDTAGQAVTTTQQLIALAAAHRQQINSLGRIANSTLRVHQELLKHPITTVKQLVHKTNMTATTVNKCLDELEQLDIVKEQTQQKRNRVFKYTRYIDIMEFGTEVNPT